MKLFTVIFLIQLWILSSVSLPQNITLGQKAGLHFAAVGGNNLALFAGGDLDSTSLSVVNIFNATLQRTTENLSQSRYSMGAASVDNLIIFAGGYSTAPKNQFSSRGTIEEARLYWR
jgi:hypothetical protein